MWPRPGEGLDRVIAAETAVEHLYLAALAEWVPAVKDAALPTFHPAVTAAVGDELPVDVAAVEQQQGWGPVAETIVVAGVSVLFAAAVVEAAKGIGSASVLPLLVGFPALQRLFPQEDARNSLVASGPAELSHRMGYDLRSPVLEQSADQRPEHLLAVDRADERRVRNLHHEPQTEGGSPNSVRTGDRSDPEAAGDRPPMPRDGVLQPESHGAGDDRGEHASRHESDLGGGAREPLHKGSPVHAGDDDRRDERRSAMPDLPECLSAREVPQAAERCGVPDVPVRRRHLQEGAHEDDGESSERRRLPSLQVRDEQAGEAAEGLTAALWRPLAVVWNIVKQACGLDEDQIREAVRLVDETPSLAAARDEVVEAQRATAAHIPRTLSRKVEAATRAVEPDESGTVTLAAQREAAAGVLDPQGAAMADLAADSWHQSAAVQNRAVLAAADLDADRDELQKIWIATLDGKTRPSHWAADGARVDLDHPFIVGGEPLMYPADPSGSPAETYSCRCRMGVLAEGEALPDEVDRHTERLDGRDSVAVSREGRTQQGEISKRRAEGNTRARDNRDGVGTVAAATPQEGDTGMPAETYLTFTDALFAVAGVPTDDRRMLAADIELNLRDFPLPLQWQERTGDGHKGSVTVGVIESMSVKDGEVRGSGYMLNNDNAVKALDLIQHGVCKPSIDMADATAVLAFADGTEVTEGNFDATVPVFETYKKGTVTAATIVAIPAFGQTGLSMNTEREERGAVEDDEAALVAAAHDQAVYDPALFAAADPNLLHPMRLTMDSDTGRVFGFIATWKDQHRSVGFGNIRPPRSETSYEHFHTSPGVHLADGTVLPVGRLTVGIGHAPTRGVSAAAAQAHYDNVSACWAMGRISEHRLGIFFSGVVAPWADPAKVQMGLASPVSGDWRPIGPNRNLELVAVLSVNTPGFLCKVETDESGSPAAMVASMGVVDQATTPDVSASWSLDDIRLVMRDVLDEREAEADRASRLTSTADRALSLYDAPLTATERMAEVLAEFEASEVDEFGIRKVRDSNYWGMPVGTPLRKGMKPRGKKRGGPSGRPAMERANVTSAKKAAGKRDPKTGEPKPLSASDPKGGKTSDVREREAADIRDKIDQLDKQADKITQETKGQGSTSEIAKKKSELKVRLAKLGSPNLSDEENDVWAKYAVRGEERGTLNSNERFIYNQLGKKAAGESLSESAKKDLAEHMAQDKDQRQMRPNDPRAKPKKA